MPPLHSIRTGAVSLIGGAALCIGPAAAQLPVPPPGLTPEQQIEWQRNYLRVLELDNGFPIAGWVFAGLLLLFLIGSYWMLRCLADRPRTGAAESEDTTGKPLLTRWFDMPLGAPEGTVRALLSIFIVVFGFLLLAFQDRLGIGNGEALAGFIGAVISFYFVTRTTEQTHQVAQTAQETLRRAGEAVSKAGEAASTAREAADTARTVTAGEVQSAPAMRQGAAAGGRLAEAREALEVLRVGLGAATTLLPPDQAKLATTVLDRVRDGLAAADRVAAGDLGGIVAGAETASGLAREVLGADNPLTGLLGDAVAGLRTASGLAAMAGIGGPAGLIAGVAFGAISALRKGTEYYERWKARILDRPYTANLFPPDGLDGAMCLATLESAPIFRRLLLDPLDQGDPMRLPRARDVCKAAQLDDAEARRELERIAGGTLAVASEDEFTAGLNELRRAMLDMLLTQAEAGEDAAPAPAGLPVATPPPAVLRTTLDRLREERGAKGLDPALLLLTSLAQSPDMTADRMATLLRLALPAVEAVTERAQREEQEELV